MHIRFVVFFFLLFHPFSLAWGVPSALWVTTSNYASSEAGTLGISPPHAWNPVSVADLSGDVVCRTRLGKIYCLNRNGNDGIHVINANQGFVREFFFPLPANSNAYDIAFASSRRAYVTRYDKSSLWVVDLSSAPGTKLDEIDLSAYAGPDGIPEMAYLFLQDDRLYVTIQRLNRNAFWMPEGTSYILSIDLDPTSPNYHEVLPDETIELLAPNPTYRMVPMANGHVAVSETGSYGALDGGIEELDLATGTSFGFIETEAHLGGDLGRIAMASPTQGYALVFGADFLNHLQAFDTQSSVPNLLHTGEFLGDLLWADHRLYVADRNSGAQGVWIWDTTNHALVSGSPFATGTYPPAEFLMLPDTVSGVRDLPNSANLSIEVHPNPFNAHVTVNLRVPQATPATLTIHDARGQLVHRLSLDRLQEGLNSFSWDGTDLHGRVCSSGNYFVLVTTPRDRMVQKLTLVK